MSTKKGATDSSIEIKETIISFDPEAGHLDGYLKIALKKPMSEKVIMLRIYSSLTGDTYYDVPIAVSGDRIIISLTSSTLRQAIAYPILRVQLYKDEQIKSSVQTCEIIFPIIEPVTSINNKEVSASWNNNKNFNKNLFFLEEISDGTATQCVNTLYGKGEITVKPDEKLGKGSLLRSRYTLLYGAVPAGCPQDKGNDYVLRKWSDYTYLFAKLVINAVICEKTPANLFTLDVKWNESNDDKTLKVKICIQSGGVNVTEQTCDANQKSFLFNDVKFDANKSYAVYVQYSYQNTLGPKSEIISIIHQIPPQFNLNYNEQKSKEYALEATWDKLVQDCTYELKVSRDGVFNNTPEATSPVLLGTETANAGVIIEGAIRAKKTISSGPWSNLLPAPFVSNSTFSFDHLGRLLEVNSDKKQISTFKYDDRGNILQKKVELKK